ncbi:hypothetical protein JCM18899A_02690 [Nocardioides sp. AN3]
MRNEQANADRWQEHYDADPQGGTGCRIPHTVRFRSTHCKRETHAEQNGRERQTRNCGPV